MTRKITRAVARIKLGLQEKTYLGNLDAKRDWGHAKDYVEGMWLMLQQDESDDYVLATGKSYSVKEFVEMAFKEVEISIKWEGAGKDEKGVHTETGKTIVEIDHRYFRPTEIDHLLGDASKAMKELGWKPKYTLEDMVKEMVVADLKLFKRDQYLLEGGHQIMNFHE